MKAGVVGRLFLSLKAIVGKGDELLNNPDVGRLFLGG